MCGSALSGLWGPAAPLGPVAAALVPRFALLPAPTPPAVLSAFGTSQTLIGLPPKRWDSAPSNHHFVTWEDDSSQNCASPNRAKPHQAGGGGGKDCGLPRSAARRAEWAALPLTRKRKRLRMPGC